MIFDPDNTQTLEWQLKCHVDLYQKLTEQYCFAKQGKVALESDVSLESLTDTLTNLGRQAWTLIKRIWDKLLAWWRKLWDGESKAQAAVKATPVNTLSALTLNSDITLESADLNLPELKAIMPLTVVRNKRTEFLDRIELEASARSANLFLKQVKAMSFKKIGGMTPEIVQKQLLELASGLFRFNKPQRNNGLYLSNVDADMLARQGVMMSMSASKVKFEMITPDRLTDPLTLSVATVQHCREMTQPVYDAISAVWDELNRLSREIDNTYERGLEFIYKAPLSEDEEFDRVFDVDKRRDAAMRLKAITDSMTMQVEMLTQLRVYYSRLHYGLCRVVSLSIQK